MFQIPKVVDLAIPEVGPVAPPIGVPINCLIHNGADCHICIREHHCAGKFTTSKHTTCPCTTPWPVGPSPVRA